MISIYALVDPRDNTVHYVGLSKNPEKRYWQHLSLGGRNQGKNQWIHELKASNLLPKLVLLEEVAPDQDAFQREAYWTIHYARARHPLTNLEKTRLGYSISEPSRRDKVW